MKNSSFLFFHFNLFFSSVEESQRKKIIKDCYYPIINIPKIYNIPINIEASAKTLLEIKRIDKKFIKIFNEMIKKKKIYFVGSGFSQIIAPLVPYEVNYKNLQLANYYYKKILGKKPETALVNEMAFSENIIDSYIELGYKNIIIDHDNLTILSKKNKNNLPAFCYSKLKKKKLNLIYASSFLFQQFQNCIYGDISINKYLHILKKYQKNKNTILPIYSGDAEVFNFRSGRFLAERDRIYDEWARLYKLLKYIKEEKKINFVLINNIKFSRKDKNFYEETAASPICVKKQPKYNVSRWAITGRSDQKINTKCFYILKNKNKIIKKIGSKKFFEKLLDLWSSDYRTHITEKRWIKFNYKLNSLIKLINNDKISNSKKKNIFKNIENSKKIYFDAEKTLLFVETSKIKIVFNVRRGLSIDSLAFKSQKFNPIIGTVHSYKTKSIHEGADFYSCNAIHEILKPIAKITDLNNVKPEITENRDIIKINSKQNLKYAWLIKTIEINKKSERILITIDYKCKIKNIGSIRLNNISFLNINNKKISYACVNGGKIKNNYNLEKYFDQTLPATKFVSVSNGLGCTDSMLSFKINNKIINLKWDNSKNYVFPSLQYKKIKSQKILRVFFCNQEYDETSHPLKSSYKFKLEINTKK